MSDFNPPIIDPLEVPVKPKRKRKLASPPSKVKKPKVARDLRSVFLEKLKEISVEKIKKPWMAEKVFRLINTTSELETWVEKVLTDKSQFHTQFKHTCPVLAVDTETTSLDTRIFSTLQQLPSGESELQYEVKVEIAGVCLSVNGIEGVYIPINHESGSNIPRADAARILQRLFDNCHLIFYNGKFDREVLRITLGINFRPYPFFEDVQVLQYINDPKADLGKSGTWAGDSGTLKKLSESKLGIEQIEIKEIAKVRMFGIRLLKKIP